MVLEVITIDLRRGLMRIVGTVWVGVLWACQQCSFGQDSLSWELDLQGYLEPYFAYDLGMPANGERPRFLYNHKRHNETSLNLAMVQMEASRGRVRGVLGAMAGDYVHYNLAREPAELRGLYKANVGYRISRSKELWLDLGILPSHIGSESAIGAENRTLTRSLLAENSPYYNAGLRLSYQPHEQLYVAAFLLNGFQQIRRDPGSSAMNFGTQVTYLSSNSTTLNFSTYLGADTWKSDGRWLFYYDLYATTEMSGSTSLAMGFDMGLQGGEGLTNVLNWFGSYGILRQQINENWWFCGRIEMMSDEDRVLLITDRPVLGTSIGVDRRLSPELLWRLEGRWLDNQREVFIQGDGLRRTNAAITSSLCLQLK